MIFDDYYNWLLDMVGLHEGYENYSSLMQYLYSRNYEYSIAMDSNRESGGLSLRSLYADYAGVYKEDVKDGPCTVLEVFVSLAIDMDDYTSNGVKECFWEMMINLGLMNYENNMFDESMVGNIIDIWLNRQFDADGTGSPFPIAGSNEDMRTVELWNQMHRYLVEKYPPGDWID